MTRDRTARNRIRTLLATQGDVEDRSGYATGVLKEAIGYEGSSVAFIQLIAAMDRDQEISREIRGKRTYRISLGERGAPTEASRVPSPASAAGDSSVLVQTDGTTVQLDYDRLARAIVRALIEVAANREPSAVTASTDEPADAIAAVERDKYLRELESARTRVDELLSASTRRTAVR